MRDFICTDRAEILPCTFNGLSDSRWRCHCACTDGGHFVLAKQRRFVCRGGHRRAGGQRDVPSVNSKQTSFSCSNRGRRQGRHLFLEHTSPSVCTRFHIIHLRRRQTLYHKKNSYSPCSSTPTTDGSIQWQNTDRTSCEQENLSPPQTNDHASEG